EPRQLHSRREHRPYGSPAPHGGDPRPGKLKALIRSGTSRKAQGAHQEWDPPKSSRRSSGVGPPPESSRRSSGMGGKISRIGQFQNSVSFHFMSQEAPR